MSWFARSVLLALLATSVGCDPCDCPSGDQPPKGIIRSEDGSRHARVDDDTVELTLVDGTTRRFAIGGLFHTRTEFWTIACDVPRPEGFGLREIVPDLVTDTVALLCVNALKESTLSDVSIRIDTPFTIRENGPTSIAFEFDWTQFPSIELEWNVTAPGQSPIHEVIQTKFRNDAGADFEPRAICL